MAVNSEEFGNILKTWDYRKVLPTDAAGSGSQDAHDWFHNNEIGRAHV